MTPEERKNELERREKATQEAFNTDNTKQMPELTQKAYKVVGLEGRSPKVFVVGFGSVDFRTLTVKSAEQLVKQGFPYLQKKTNADKSADKAGKAAS